MLLFYDFFFVTERMDAFLKNKKVNKEEKTDSKAIKEPKPELPNKPWVEKYRPKTVDDVVEQTEIVSVLKQVKIVLIVSFYYKVFVLWVRCWLLILNDIGF